VGVSPARVRLFIGAEERKTAFERNLLPDFADWLVDEIEQRRPDVLIPAGTKGARVLDAALSYAARERGVSPGVPVIYRSALDFISSERLAGYKALSVEDAVQTGESLKRHRDAITGHRIGEISAVACMGWGRSVSQAEVDCFMRVDEELYKRVPLATGGAGDGAGAASGGRPFPLRAAIPDPLRARLGTSA
jgi:hypothetical protein